MSCLTFPAHDIVNLGREQEGSLSVKALMGSSAARPRPPGEMGCLPWHTLQGRPARLVAVSQPSL